MSLRLPFTATTTTALLTSATRCSRTGLPAPVGSSPLPRLTRAQGTGGTNYLVLVTVSNLAAGDTDAFSLVTAGIDEVEGGVTESGSVTNAADTEDSVGNVVREYRRPLS